MDVSFRQVRAIDAGVWAGRLAAAEAAKLPGAPLKIAGPHVVLVERPAWNGSALTAPFAGVSVLALGHRDEAIYLSAEAGCGAPARRAASAAVAEDAPTSNPRDTGADETFIYQCDEIGSDMVRIARALMARIRATYDGALSQTDNPRKFVETPDNFWGVEIQPRKAAIKLIVRASEERMKASGLPYQSERPPAYWAMRVCGDRDVESALRFLALAQER